MAEKMCVVNVVEQFWSVWYWEYLEGPQEQICESLGRKAAVIKVGDAVMIGKDVVPTHRWWLRTVIELIKSNDIQCPVNPLYSTEVCATEQLYRKILKNVWQKLHVQKRMVLLQES